MLLLNKTKLLRFKEIDRLEIVLKWEEIGLLVGLRNKDKTQLALYFEELLNYLMLTENTLYRSTQYETLMFPVLRRIYERNIGKKINVRALAIDFRMFTSGHYFKQEIDRFQEHPHIDIEAELVADYASKYKI